MSFSLNRTINKLQDVVKGSVLGQDGPQNPYTPPDVNYLRNYSAFDYLKNDLPENKYMTGLTGGVKSYQDYYTAPETSTFSGYYSDPGVNRWSEMFRGAPGVSRFSSYYNAPTVNSFYDTYRDPGTRMSDSYFRSYINAINAPSSVDQVTRGIESARLGETLSDIDRRTRQGVANSAMGYYNRGLTGDGNDSDISRVGMAQAEAEGTRAAKDAYLTYATGDLERQKAQEEAVRQAYGQRYQTGVGTESQMRGISSQGALTDIDTARGARDISVQGAMADLQSAKDLQAMYNQGAMADIETQRGLRDIYAEGALGDQEAASRYRDLVFGGAQSDANAYNEMAYRQAVLGDSAIGRMNDRQLGLAGIINQRDLGAAGQLASLYNAGADRNLRGTTPGGLDSSIMQFFTQAGKAAGPSTFEEFGAGMKNLFNGIA